MKTATRRQRATWDVYGDVRQKDHEGRSSLALDYRLYRVQVRVSDIEAAEVDAALAWIGDQFPGVEVDESAVSWPEEHDCPTCYCDDRGADVRFEVWLPARSAKAAADSVSALELPMVGAA